MSARGARSRKIQAKDIEKKEKKIGKSKAIEPHDGFVDWRATPTTNSARNGISRTLTATSRTTSRSSGTNDSRSRTRQDYSTGSSSSKPPQSAASASVSDVSTQGREKARFQANGKETKAPRGRGGGVPVKRTIAPSPAPPIFRNDSVASYPSPHEKTWTGFKVWEGGKDGGMRPYAGFEHDQDMNSGSVLIYFTEEQGDEDIPIPSIRAELNVLESSGSTWLSNALLYGRIDDDDDEWTLPTSPESSTSQQHSYLNPDSHRQRTSPQQQQDLRNPNSHHQRMLRPTSPAGRSPPAWDIDQSYDGISTRTASRLDACSGVRSGRSNSPPPLQRTIQRNPTHEIWFPAPKHIKTAQGQRMHHVAIRNFLAMLHGKPIVGADLFDMLNTLQPEIEVMYDLDNSQSSMTPRQRSVQMITNYLGQHGIDDVRTSIKSAMCLLAWSEQDNVQWRQGYLETFAHLAGVMIPELEEVPEFKRLSIVTRRNLGIAAKSLQLRVMEAEEKLSTFDFTDLWEDSSKASNSPVFQSYQAFRSFLVSHYTRNYGNWPPASNKTWLNRKVVLALQEDFGSLYDYLVNRDVIWNPREERASRKWEMAHRTNADFKADVPELGVTDLLVRFDAKFGYAHIPHPYPLLPRAIPKTTKEKEKKSFFGGLKKEKSRESSTKDAKAHLQLSILFSDATNIEKLDVNFNGSTLIDKFEQFEMTTDLKASTPREARLGRWVLLYGILQVLSTLSVDVQGIKHIEGVRYFLCTDLKRLPEWVVNGQLEYLQASQKRSWCWQRAWDPAPVQSAPVELEATATNEAANVHTVQHHRNNNAEINTSRHRERTRRTDRSPSQPPTPLDLNTTTDLDGATLLQNDIRRINEKISTLALPPNSHSNATTHFPDDYSRRHQNEKSLPSDFDDWKPRYDSLPHPRPPTTSPNFPLPRAVFDFTLQAPRLPPRSPMRDTLNTDLAGYPFSAGEDEGDDGAMRWPVPPGYSEREGDGRALRESGIGYEVGGFGEGRDGSWRSPRGVHERGGW